MRYRYEVWATPTVRVVSGSMEAAASDEATLLLNALYPRAHGITTVPTHPHQGVHHGSN